MSELKVNKISPSSGTAFTIGDSGDTFTVPSGATLTVAGTFTQTGAQTFDGGVDIDNFNINGTTITLSSGDMTLDVAGDIILDADGGEILFHDATTAMGHISMASSNITLKSLVSDKDIIFQGNDGGAGITALTLDMSAAGAATFNNAITSGAVITSGAGLVIADTGNIGSASDTDAIAIAADGVVTFSQVPLLPDNTVATADIQDNAITLAKLAGGTDGNIISFDASGDPVAIATGSDGQVLTSTGAGSPPAFEALPASGITEFDMYRLTASITANTDPIASNLERVDDATFSKIGTGVSLASGVFSFPSTGLWQVGHIVQITPDTNDTVAFYQYTTANNGTAWDQVAQSNFKSGSGAASSGKVTNWTLVNCTNVSNVKVKFACGSFENSTSNIPGNSDFNYTSFFFIRIGDSQ